MDESDAAALPEDAGMQTATQTLPQPEPNQLQLTEIISEPNLLELVAEDRFADAEAMLEANYLLGPNRFKDNWESIVGEQLELEADDWQARLVKFLQGYRKDGPPTTVRDEIPIYELHCPAVPQCETSGELSTTKERDVDMSLALSGIELGGSKKYKCEGKVKEFAYGACSTIYMEVIVSYQRWVVKNNPKAKVLRTLVQIDQAGNSFENRLEITGNHYCRKFTAALPDFNDRASWRSKRVSRTINTSNGKVSGEMPAGDQASTFNFQIKLSPPWLPGDIAASSLGLKFALQTRIESGLKLTYDLHGHYQYVAFDRVFGGGPVYWLWKDLDSAAADRGWGKVF